MTHHNNHKSDRPIMQDAIALAIFGDIDTDTLEAINTAVTHNEILKDEDLAPIVDADGDRLVRNGVYLYRGKKIRVTRWQFGSGNFMDCWYWLWFIDSDLKDGRMTIDGRVQKDLSKVYRSGLEKIKE